MGDVTADYAPNGRSLISTTVLGNARLHDAALVTSLRTGGLKEM